MCERERFYFIFLQCAQINVQTFILVITLVDVTGGKKYNTKKLAIIREKTLLQFTCEIRYGILDVPEFSNAHFKKHKRSNLGKR